MSTQLTLDGLSPPSAPTDRLFFALFPPPELARRIADDWAERRRALGLKGRPVDAHRLHITLVHLGDHAGLPPGLVAQAQQVAEAMAPAPAWPPAQATSVGSDTLAPSGPAAADAGVAVQLDQLTTFAGRRKLPVLTTAATDTDLHRFQALLVDRLRRAGLGRWMDRSTQFTPHITLEYGDQVVPTQPVPPVAWQATDFSLVHSLIGQHRHVPQGRWRLAAVRTVAPFSVLVPARMASSRLPDKPLADIAGLPMVVRVAQAAARSQARQVVVAADDPRIVRACEAHGVAALLTRADHPSGSDRLAEACSLLGLAEDEQVVNVQGDEPLVAPAMVDACADLLGQQADCVMATVAHAIEDTAEFINPNVVKVVLDAAQRALYFSRAPIGWWRDGFADGLRADTPLPAQPRPLRHLGLYAYRVGFLKQFPALPAAPLEQLESLEQLRVLWHGHRIAVHVSPERPGPGVDTPEDLARVRALFGQAPGG